MSKIPFLMIVSLCAFLVMSCEQERLAVPEIKANEFWDCHKSQELDSIKLASKLVGAWTWKKQACYWGGKTVYADKDLQVTFTGNRICILRENSSIVSQGSWKLKAVDSNMFVLDLEHSSIYLHGIILLCNGEVVFSDSYIDGCDYLFTKVD